jgi:hypothetical protein
LAARHAGATIGAIRVQMPLVLRQSSMKTRRHDGDAA